MHYMYNIPGQSAHTCCTNSRMPFSCLFLEISLSELPNLSQSHRVLSCCVPQGQQARVRGADKRTAFAL